MRWGKISIKGKIFSCLAVFSICILIVLWLLQTVFLDEFYQMIKENEVRSYSQTIADNINLEDLTELLNQKGIDTINDKGVYYIINGQLYRSNAYEYA